MSTPTGFSPMIENLFRQQNVKKLIRATRNHNEEICIDAIKALGEIGDRQATLPLERIFKRSKQWWIRRVVVEALGNIDDPATITALALGIEDDSFSVRIKAVEALGKKKDNRIIPILGSALRDQDFRVQDFAVQILRGINSTDAKNLVEKYCEEKGMEENIKPETKKTKQASKMGPVFRTMVSFFQLPWWVFGLLSVVLVILVLWGTNTFESKYRLPSNIPPIPEIYKEGRLYGAIPGQEIHIDLEPGLESVGGMFQITDYDVDWVMDEQHEQATTPSFYIPSIADDEWDETISRMKSTAIKMDVYINTPNNDELRGISGYFWFRIDFRYPSYKGFLSEGGSGPGYYFQNYAGYIDRKIQIEFRTEEQEVQVKAIEAARQEAYKPIRPFLMFGVVLAFIISITFLDKIFSIIRN